MTKWIQLAKRLRCARKGHDWEFYPIWGTRNNMYVCKRCGEPGWRV